jgi:hypothetical protein
MLPTNPSDTDQQWLELIEIAERLRAMKPWEDIMEDEIFAIQPTPGGTVYFPSIMGQLGEHTAIAFYEGRDGLGMFRAAQDDSRAPEKCVELILLNGHHQAAFVSAKELLEPERALFKRLGKRYRGHWPVFRAHRAARLPARLPTSELPLMRALLEQTLDVLEREFQGDELLRDSLDDSFFLRTPDGTDATIRVADLPEHRHHLRVTIDSADLDDLPVANRKAEMDLALLTSGIDDVPEGEAPYLPFALLLVDAESSMILGMELIPTADGVDAAFAHLPKAIARTFRQSGSIPSRVAANHPILLSALGALAKVHDFETIPSPDLPALAPALHHLRHHALG